MVFKRHFMLNINSDAAVKHTNTLEKMHRSALPNAIRATLNGTAFDVKKNTMPDEAAQQFTQRNPNFFKANSRVEMAKGFDVNNMKSVVGFIAKDQAVEDLEQQEYGGTIESRSFIPMDTARMGGNNSKLKSTNRISKVRKIVNSNTMAGATPQAKFAAAAKKAGRGGYVIGNTPKQTLWRIESIDGGIVKKKPLFSYKKGRDVNVTATRFMRSASIQSTQGMERLYAIEAKKQIERLNK
jgi:hypothetical protein